MTFKHITYGQSVVCPPWPSDPMKVRDLVEKWVERSRDRLRADEIYNILYLGRTLTPRLWGNPEMFQ